MHTEKHIGINCAYKNRIKMSFFLSLLLFSLSLSLSTVATSLSYIRLKDLVSRNPILIPVALNRICFLLHTVSLKSHTGALVSSFYKLLHYHTLICTCFIFIYYSLLLSLSFDRRYHTLRIMVRGNYSFL